MRMQVVLLSCFAIFHVTFAENECYINVKDGMHRLSPPLVIDLSNTSQHMHPTLDRPGDLTFREGKKFLVICPGLPDQSRRDNIIEVGSVKAGNQTIALFSATVKCIKNNEFLIDGQKIPFSEISCAEKSPAKYTAILRPSDRKCDKGVRYEIGYDLGYYGFLELIQLCHDLVKARTLWAHATIQPANKHSTRFSGYFNSHVKNGSLYEGSTTVDLYDLYTQKKIDQMFKDMGKGNWTMPRGGGNKYLAKGHLIARADMMFMREQRSTYFFANTVPMWQNINQGGNWYLVEEFVRSQANRLKRPLGVYAGGLGTLNVDDKLVHLYKSKKIPIPEVLFKCMLDHQDKQGLCLLVVNNPYINVNNVEDYVICHRSDACDEHSKKFERTKKGFAYCCSLSNFYYATWEELGNELRPFRNYEEMRDRSLDEVNALFNNMTLNG